MLSIIALVVSGCALLWAIVWGWFIHRRDTRWRLRVIADRGDLSVGGGHFRDMLSMKAVNVCRSRLTIDGVNVEVKGSKKVLFLNLWDKAPAPRLPAKLDPGDTCTAAISVATLADGASKLPGAKNPHQVRLVVQDAAGGFHRSGWVRIS